MPLVLSYTTVRKWSSTRTDARKQIYKISTVKSKNNGVCGRKKKQENKFVKFVIGNKRRFEIGFHKSRLFFVLKMNDLNSGVHDDGDNDDDEDNIKVQNVMFGEVKKD